MASEESRALVNSPSEKQEGRDGFIPKSRTKRVLLGLNVAFVAFMTTNLILECITISQGNGRSPGALNWIFTTVRLSWAGGDCIHEAPEGTFPLSQPLGTCSYLSKEYDEAPAYSPYVRHAMTGDYWKIRLFIFGVHDFGALSVVFLLACIFIGRGENGASKLESVAGFTLWTTVVSMFFTGLTMYLFRVLTDPTELGLAVPAFSWFKPWIHVYFGMFGMCFVSACGHAFLNKPYPASVLMVQHMIAILCSCIFFIGITIQLCTLPVTGHKWSYALEAAYLGTIYPILDILGVVTLVKGNMGNKEGYDWDAHRNYNLQFFTMLIITIIIAFGVNQHYYLFDLQLSVLARLSLESIPIMIWVMTGHPIQWVKNVIALAKSK